jgi:hypothetical protein
MTCSHRFGVTAKGEVGSGNAETDGSGAGPGNSVRIGAEKKERIGRGGRPRETQVESEREKYARRRSDFDAGDETTAMYDDRVIELVTRCILHMMASV